MLRLFGRMIFKWPGVERPSCPTLIVHGDRDKLIPPRCARPDLWLSGAGHCFTLTHAEQTSAAISGFVSSLPASC
jgi:pimeloyl-ACP methyl ester carboxylesterase